MNFQGDSGVTPDPAPFQVGGKLDGSQALVTTLPRFLKPDSRDLETETGSAETEKMVQRIHGTLEKEGIMPDPSQLGGPTRGAGGLIIDRS